MYSTGYILFIQERAKYSNKYTVLEVKFKIIDHISVF